MTAKQSRFDQIDQEMQAIATKDIGGMNDSEKSRLIVWGGLKASLFTEAFNIASQEAERRAESTALKDRVLRVVNGGYLMPDTKDPQTIKAAQQNIANRFDEGVAAAAQRSAQKSSAPVAVPSPVATPHTAADVQSAPPQLVKDVTVSAIANVNKRKKPQAKTPQ